MDEERTLIIGFDLCNDYSQISCLQKNSNEPESVCITPDKTKYLIPTAVCVRETTKEWLIGEEAERCRDRQGGEYIEGLLDKLERQETVTIYGSVLSAETLLEKFFRKVLGIIRQRFQNNSILKLVLTPEHLSFETENRLYLILETLGMQKDRVRIISHTMSFMYYIVNQPGELWVNDVALFDYSQDGLRYCQLNFGGKSIPNAVVAEVADLSDSISYEMLTQKPIERLTHQLEAIAGLTLHKKILTSLFFAGRGFDGSWSDSVLRGLCMGRRVFKGQNLYTKGACYAARAIQQGGLEKYLFLTEDMVIFDISLKVYHDSEMTLLPLVTAGDLWKTGGTTCSLIMDDTTELEFVVSNPVSKSPIQEIVTLEGPIRRENKSVRLELKLSFIDRETAVVKLKDTGFGEFYPNSCRVWEQILKLTQ